MKRFLILIITSIFVMPAFGACGIDGSRPCTATILDNDISLQEKLAPNPLDEISKTDAFQPQYKEPYNNALIKTTPKSSIESTDYNSNCQFGVCLPGVETDSEIIE